MPPEAEPVFVAACDRLLEDLDGVTREIAAVIRAEEPVYLEVMTEEELAAAVRPNAIGLLESLKRREVRALVAPRQTGRERARQGVPLITVLHAYRLGAGHLWDRLVRLCADDPEAGRALLGSASVLWATVDNYSQELAASYRFVEAEQLRADARLREATLAALFSGAATPGQTVADVAATLGLPRTGAFVVLACDPPPLDHDTATPQVERTLAGRGVRSVWRSEPDGELGLVLLPPAHGLDELQDCLRALSSGATTVGRIGVSQVFESVVATPAAVAQARRARGTAAPGEVVTVADARVAALLVLSPGPAAELAREVLGDALALPDDEQTMLLETLRVWYLTGSAAAAAARLHCHPNTVRYRLAKLSRLTGRDLHAPLDVVHLFLAMEAVRLVPGESTDGPHPWPAGETTLSP